MKYRQHTNVTGMVYTGMNIHRLYASNMLKKRTFMHIAISYHNVALFTNIQILLFCAGKKLLFGNYRRGVCVGFTLQSNQVVQIK